MLTYLGEAVFEEEFDRVKDHEEAAKRLRQHLADKIALVREKLFTPPAEQRFARFKSAVGPCLDDLDVEVVTQRRDAVSERSTTVPFLRLRLRYTDGAAVGMPFPFLVQWGWGPPQALGGRRSFEFECDESDIDLLLRRLVAAKDMLLNALQTTEQSGKSIKK